MRLKYDCGTFISAWSLLNPADLRPAKPESMIGPENSLVFLWEIGYFTVDEFKSKKVCREFSSSCASLTWIIMQEPRSLVN